MIRSSFYQSVIEHKSWPFKRIANQHCMGSVTSEVSIATHPRSRIENGRCHCCCATSGPWDRGRKFSSSISLPENTEAQKLNSSSLSSRRMVGKSASCWKSSELYMVWTTPFNASTYRRIRRRKLGSPDFARMVGSQ